MSFEYLGLSDTLLEAVKEAGYSTPTPIQRQAIPAVLQGRDVIGIAQTGTGKTASFTLPMIDILSQGRAKARMPRTLILEPTRELAAQVAENFENYGKHSKLSMALLIGGVSFSDQEAKLERGVDVLIATPGRLLDHFSRGKLMLNGVQILVVDECDRMLDMGFIPDVESICQKMPQSHQTLFFSATLSKEIKRLTDQFLNDPKLIEVAPPASTAANVTQGVVVVGPREKNKALRSLISAGDLDSAIVFCNRKVDVKSVYTSLRRASIAAGQLHGDMTQTDRMDTLARFKAGEVKVLVASDVAARGLDIPSVSHVFNYDVPHHSEDYVHRIGRTGRAGRSGKAIMLALSSDAKFIFEIEKLIGRSIERIEVDGIKSRALEGDDNTSVKKKAETSQKSNTPSRSKIDTEKTKSATEDKQQTNKQAKAPKGKSKNPQPSTRDGKGTDKGKSDGGHREDKSPRQSGKDTRPAKDNRHDKDSRNRDRHQGRTKSDQRDQDGPVVGLGSHVPAFLMRPVPKR